MLKLTSKDQGTRGLITQRPRIKLNMTGKEMVNEMISNDILLCSYTGTYWRDWIQQLTGVAAEIHSHQRLGGAQGAPVKKGEKIV